MRVITGMLAMLLGLSAGGPVFAGETRIVDVKVQCSGSCTFLVTLEHDDEGWDHYANQWDVVTMDGRLLKSRVLFHPHENEQPFTRSLSGVKIPAGTKSVKIRAKDSVHGYSKQEYTVQIPGAGQ
ncbi:MAG: hypothetical protein DRQ59_03750 [Gammaproteobacteria bacterium]|nr:MAG: hypothetical protein DRQ59_03750 [Gammaproteobacteria bacterium]